MANSTKCNSIFTVRSHLAQMCQPLLLYWNNRFIDISLDRLGKCDKEMQAHADSGHGSRNSSRRVWHKPSHKNKTSWTDCRKEEFPGVESCRRRRHHGIRYPFPHSISLPPNSCLPLPPSSLASSTAAAAARSRDQHYLYLTSFSRGLVCFRSTWCIQSRRIDCCWLS